MVGKAKAVVPETPAVKKQNRVAEAWTKQAESEGKKFKKQTKTSLANLVQACIRQNVPDLTHFEIDVMRNKDGRTLREVVTEAKISVIEGKSSVSFGKTWWNKEIRQQFSASTNIMNLLALPKDSEEKVIPPCSGLMTAVKAACESPPNRVKLGAWARNVTSMSASDCISLLRVMTKMDPRASKQQRDVLCDSVCALARCGAATLVPNELKSAEMYIHEVGLQGWSTCELNLSSIVGLMWEKDCVESAWRGIQRMESENYLLENTYGTPNCISV
eukprot:6455422-Amphidinium_carterae.4